jgi:hypothetical protein
LETSLTAAERSLRGKLASYESWAKTPDRSARTAPGRAAQLARFEKLVDPDGTMPPEARAKAAEAAKQAHYARMALLSAKARRTRKAKELIAEVTETELAGGDAA